MDSFTSQIINTSATLPLSFPIHGKVSRGYDVDYAIACGNKGTVNSSLQSLNASHCNIKEFPGFFALFFPRLEILDLSYNKLQFCCAINELPVSLRKLDISNNLLQNSNEKVFYFSAHLSMKSSSMQHRDLCKLQTLTLANNVDLNSLKLSDDMLQDDKHVFFPKLLRLNLTNCGLQQLPSNLVELQDLTDLNISHNKDLTIPQGICNLENLVNFSYDGIKDSIVNELNKFTQTPEKLRYLHQTQ